MRHEINRRQFLGAGSALAVGAVAGVVALPVEAAPAEAQGRWDTRWVRRDCWPLGGEEWWLHVGFFFGGNHHDGTLSGVLFRPGTPDDSGRWTFRVGNSFATFDAKGLEQAQELAIRQMAEWLTQSLRELERLAHPVRRA